MVIVGGGVIGSAIATFLAARDDFGGSVAVVERDPTYAASSTALSVGGVRQQFSTPENIAMSRFTAEFVAHADEYLAVDGKTPDLGFVEAGYLFLATAAGLDALRHNHTVQRRCGVEVRLFDPGELAHRFPWLETGDLAAGSLGLRGEGWLDPSSLLRGFVRKARSLGVEYVAGEVVALRRAGPRVSAAVLADGSTLSCGTLVDAAGPRAARVAAMAGVADLPVHPRKRQVHVFDCPEPLPGCPLVVDPTGLYFRPESGRFLCGLSPPDAEDPDCLDLEADPGEFEHRLWPLLARRVPAFDRVRRRRSWAGHYAVNVRDRNAVLGPHPEVTNLVFASGFSGHGLQQAPAVGRAVSELIALGRYRTLDLGRLSFARLAAGRLLPEVAVV